MPVDSGKMDARSDTAANSCPFLRVSWAISLYLSHMQTSLETGIFDTVGGLPIHPLVVHFAVVLLPLAALALILLVMVRKWADRFGWVTLAALAVGTAAAFVARESGQSLAARVGEPQPHATWGAVLPWLALALLVLAALWLILRRNSEDARGPRPAARLIGIVTALLAIVVIGATVVVGHSGAVAVWGAVVKPEAPAVAPTTSSASPSGTTPSAAPTTSQSPTGSATTPTLTMEEVARHADAASCWAVINGNVYDLTAWIDQHPGGSQRILAICGQDATTAFEGQHAGNARAEETLKTFLLGPLR